MARVHGITLPAGTEVYYNKTLKMYDVRVNCNVGKNRRFMTRKRRYNLREFTKLYDVAYAWAQLDQSVKDEWYNAGQETGLTGYCLFTQDKIHRLLNGMSGNASPSIYHQYKVGHIKIESPSESCKVVQHQQKSYSLPATFKISYYSDCSSTGSNSYIRAYFEKVRMRGGKNMYEKAAIVDIPLSSGWNKQEITVDDVPGAKGIWFVGIEMNQVQGDLYFDNVMLEFDNTLQNDDAFCDFFPYHWYEEDVGDGVTLESIYCPDSIV